jgi:hypothetical protein
MLLSARLGDTVRAMTKAPRNPKTLPRLSPHSRLLKRGCVDGRSREGRFLAAARAELAVDLGREPSQAERVLIDRISWLRLHVMLIDERVAGGHPMASHDQRAYLAFSNSIARMARVLGLRPLPARPLTPDEALARIHGRSEAA